MGLPLESLDWIVGRLFPRDMWSLRNYLLVARSWIYPNRDACSKPLTLTNET